MYSRSCTANCPQATAPRQKGSVLHELHCLLPTSSAGVRCKRATAHYMWALRRCIAGAALPTAPSSMAEHCKSCTAHCPWPMGSAMQQWHCRLPVDSAAMHCRGSTASYPRAVRQCIARVLLPTVPRKRGRALQEFRLMGRTPRPPGLWAGALQEFHWPPSPGGVALHCRK